LYVEAGGVCSNHWVLKALSINGDQLFLNGSNERNLYHPTPDGGKEFIFRNVVNIKYTPRLAVLKQKFPAAAFKT
jgi:hypothetical protein